MSKLYKCGFFRHDEVTRDDISTPSDVKKFHTKCGNWYKLWSDVKVATENDIPDSWNVPCVGNEFGRTGTIHMGGCKVPPPPGIDYACPEEYTAFKHDNARDFLLKNIEIDGKVQSVSLEKAASECDLNTDCKGLFYHNKDSVIPRFGNTADWDGSKTFTHNADGQYKWCVKKEHNGSIKFS